MRHPDVGSPAQIDTFDGGGSALYRLWHPSDRTRHGLAMRTFGPLYPLNPHPPADDTGPADHGENGPAVWYGSLSIDTAVRETFARHERTEHGGVTVEICPEMRVTVASDEPDGWREFARHRVIDDAVWVYVQVALDEANVAWDRVGRCGRCPDV